MIYHSHCIGPRVKMPFWSIFSVRKIENCKLCLLAMTIVTTRRLLIIQYFVTRNLVLVPNMSCAVTAIAPKKRFPKRELRLSSMGARKHWHTSQTRKHHVANAPNRGFRESLSCVKKPLTPMIATTVTNLSSCVLQTPSKSMPTTMTANPRRRFPRTAMQEGNQTSEQNTRHLAAGRCWANTIDIMKSTADCVVFSQQTYTYLVVYFYLYMLK